MKAAGYNVPQDGSWGPYQQQIWNKLNTREKEYKPTVWGLLQKGYDTITGNTTYKIPEATIRPTSGNIGTTHTAEYRNANYWHPIWGAGQRWKSSMSNDTNPFVGIGRTIVPAVAGALIAEYAPAVATKATTTIPHVVKAVTSHPRLTSRIAGKGLFNFGKTLIKGIIGGEAVNEGTKLLTGGQNWGEAVSPYLGISPDLAQWLNPGYLLGGKSWGITKGYKRMRQAKADIAVANQNQLNAEEAYKQAEQAYNAEGEALENLRAKVNDVFNQITAHNDTESQLLARVKRMKPFDRSKLQKWKRLRNQLVLSDDVSSQEFPVIGHYPGTTFEAPRTDASTFDVTFTGLRGPYTSRITTTENVPSTWHINPKDFNLSKMGDDVTLKGLQQGRFGEILQGDVEQLRRGIGEYVDQLNGVMGEDGAVAGSLIHYKNGILRGTAHDRTFIGPADTEIYTTQQRLPGLMQRLQFNESRLNSTGGHKGTSPFTFRNTDAAHNGVDTEINLIEADGNGMATGKIAHQIYRALYPEKYSQMIYDNTMSGNLVPTSRLSLPMTAEDLFQRVRTDPEAMQTHLLSDMVGMETFTNPQHTKATKRLFSVLFNPDYGTPQRLSNAMKVHGQYNMGSQFRLGTELYPNLSFDNIEANKTFLKSIYGLTDAEATKFATNPDIMRNAFNMFNFSMSTNTRLLGNDVITKKVGEQLYHNPKIELFEGNGAFSGGQGSGAGMNNTLLNPAAGWHYGRSLTGFDRNLLGITQRPLTYHPENIRTPVDLLSQVNRLSKVDSRPYYSGEQAVFHTNKPIEYNTAEMDRIRQLSYNDDVPVILGLGNFGFGYSGTLARPIASGTRFVVDGDAAELGSLLPDIVNARSSTPHTWTLSQLPKEVQQSVADFRSGGNRFIQNEVVSRWPTLSYSERGKLLKGITSPDGQYYIQYDKPSIEYNNGWLEKGILPEEYNFLSPADISHRLQYLTAYSQQEGAAEGIAKANKAWSTYMKKYKDARRQAYEAQIKGQQLRRDYKLSSLEYRRRWNNHLRDQNYYQSKRNMQQSWQDANNARWQYTRAKNNFTDTWRRYAIFGGLGTLPIGFGYLYRNQRDTKNRYALSEYLGDMDPSNGFLRHQMQRDMRYEDLDFDQMQNYNKYIRQTVSEAQQRFNSKHKKGKKSFEHKNVLNNR